MLSILYAIRIQSPTSLQRKRNEMTEIHIVANHNYIKMTGIDFQQVTVYICVHIVTNAEWPRKLSAIAVHFTHLHKQTNLFFFVFCYNRISLKITLCLRNFSLGNRKRTLSFSQCSFSSVSTTSGVKKI